MCIYFSCYTLAYFTIILYFILCIFYLKYKWTKFNLNKWIFSSYIYFIWILIAKLITIVWVHWKYDLEYLKNYLIFVFKVLWADHHLHVLQCSTGGSPMNVLVIPNFSFEVYTIQIALKKKVRLAEIQNIFKIQHTKRYTNCTTIQYHHDI